MTYQVVFHAKADAETIGLPEEAFTALIDVLAKVAKSPYDPATTLATSDPQIRRAVFAALGLCSFHIDQATQTLRVFDITWTG